MILFQNLLYMQKYILGIDISQFDFEWEGETDLSVIEFVRNYYDKYLPVDVTAWMRVNQPDECWKKEYLERQICFVRDVLCDLLTPEKEIKENELLTADVDELMTAGVNRLQPMVISTYVSKSIKFPVYQIDLKESGIEIILRNNTYDWKVSIKSEKPLDFDYMGLLDPTDVIYPIYCECFPVGKKYGSYEQNHSRFTFEMWDDYKLYTFFFLLKNYLNQKKESFKKKKEKRLREEREFEAEQIEEVLRDYNDALGYYKRNATETETDKPKFRMSTYAGWVHRNAVSDALDIIHQVTGGYSTFVHWSRDVYDGYTDEWTIEFEFPNRKAMKYINMKTWKSIWNSL